MTSFSIEGANLPKKFSESSPMHIARSTNTSHFDKHINTKFNSLIVRILQQFQDNTLDVLADIAGLRQCRTITNGKRHVQALGDRLGEQRLPRPGRSQHQQIALLQLQLVRLLVQQLRPG